VVDGQGGGIGAAIVQKLAAHELCGVDIWALGTNAVATANMMKAGANRGASGANAISRSLPSATLVVGPLGIVLANAMMGEVTPEIAAAVASCEAQKILLPLNICDVDLVAVESEPLPHLIDRLVRKAVEYLQREGNSV
jgi:hypothetical protein